jgi:hypothetical protein
MTRFYELTFLSKAFRLESRRFPPIFHARFRFFSSVSIILTSLEDDFMIVMRSRRRQLSATARLEIEFQLIGSAHRHCTNRANTAWALASIQFFSPAFFNSE